MRKLSTSAVLLFIMLTGLTLMAQEQQLPLGDVARQTRQHNSTIKTRHVYTNDDLPAVPQSAIKTQAKASGTAKNSKDTTATSAAKTLRREAAALKRNITDIQHEIEVLRLEQKLRISTYGANTPENLRTYEQETKANADEVEAKTTALTAAKDKLDEIESQATASNIDLTPQSDDNAPDAQSNSPAESQPQQAPSAPQNSVAPTQQN